MTRWNAKMYIFHTILPEIIDPLHDPVTWYKITHAGEQLAQWDFQNKATRTSQPWPAFVLEVPLCNLLTSMCDFVPCDRIVQRAHLLLLIICFILNVMIYFSSMRKHSKPYFFSDGGCRWTILACAKYLLVTLWLKRKGIAEISCSEYNVRILLLRHATLVAKI